MGVVRATLFLVGVSIGAGFISGAELVSFLACEYVLWAIALFAIAFFLLCFQLLSLGKKYGGYEGAFRALFKRKSGAALWIMPLFSLFPCAGMLSGLDALLPRLTPLPSLVGIAVVLIVLRFGMKGMSWLNLVLVPVLLLIIFTGGRPLSYDDPTLRFGGFGWLSYAGMNVFLALPTLLDAGREIKSPLFASLCSSVVTAIVAAVVLGQIVYEGANALQAELPLLYVMRESVFFYLVSALAIFSSLTASVYALFQCCRNQKGRAAIARKTAALCLAFALSRLGLNKIVTFVYPVFGFFGIVFSLFCLLHEYFFKKHDKKVHSCGKQTENQRRRHDKIEAEHLPAVHDQVAEPRTGHDVFAHNRADPAHSHRHFQHRNKGGERGG